MPTLTFDVVVRNFYGQSIVDIYTVKNCKDEVHARQKFFRVTRHFRYGGKANRANYTFEFVRVRSGEPRHQGGF